MLGSRLGNGRWDPIGFINAPIGFIVGVGDILRRSWARERRYAGLCWQRRCRFRLRRLPF